MSAQRSWRARRGGNMGYTKPESALKVERFSGPYKFLSNFYWSQLNFEGLSYPSVEHAFQAAKLQGNQQRVSFGFTDPNLSFGDAKRLGRQVPLREDWKDIRENVMAQCLWAKFQDPQLQAKLLKTGDCELVDGHSGSPDVIWGYHIPSQQGENRLGILLMDLRSKLQEFKVQQPKGLEMVALFHLDWPVKCLQDGLPQAYATRIKDLALSCRLQGRCVVLPGRKICIALRGAQEGLATWEHWMRTEQVDVNSRGRPCRERMLVELMRKPLGESPAAEFQHQEAKDWPSLVQQLSHALSVDGAEISDALGPEAPQLPRKLHYVEGRQAIMLDGQRVPLCLNESVASELAAPLLGPLASQGPHGPGLAIRLGAASPAKPSIFGGKFARELPGLLSDVECQQLIEVSEKEGYGLAGSRGFNPLARYALRCLLDAPQVSRALTERLRKLLPGEYPPNSGQKLLGVNQRLRFLKYLPGMHHADHTDCAHEDEQGRSFLTIQLYLNCDFQGGRTTFISDQLVPIEPAVGKAIVFDHELYHRGGMVTSGVKYAVRLDVSYSKAPFREPSEGADAPKKSRWGRK